MTDLGNPSSEVTELGVCPHSWDTDDGDALPFGSD